MRSESVHPNSLTTSPVIDLDTSGERWGRRKGEGERVVKDKETGIRTREGSILDLFVQLH